MNDISSVFPTCATPATCGTELTGDSELKIVPVASPSAIFAPAALLGRSVKVSPLSSTVSSSTITLRKV